MNNDTVILENESDIKEAIGLVRAYGTEYLYTKIDIEQLVLATSEIAGNAIRHAGGGEFTIVILKKGGLLRVIISDNGPGIPNVELAKREGYSSINTSLGLGLIAAERSVDHFHVDSEVDSGTQITMEKHRPIKHEVVDYGIVSIADSVYNFNGDQYLIKEYDGDSVLIGLIDGPGQGYDAFAISNSCKEYILANYRLPIEKLLSNLDTLMKESKDEVGITASLARVTPGKFIYKGYGDTHAYMVRDSNFNYLINQAGRLGQVSKYRAGVSEYSFNDKLQLVLCTDGLSTLPIINAVTGTAQQIANKLFDKHHKSHGDASILTLSYRNEKSD